MHVKVERGTQEVWCIYKLRMAELTLYCLLFYAFLFHCRHSTVRTTSASNIPVLVKGPYR